MLLGSAAPACSARERLSWARAGAEGAGGSGHIGGEETSSQLYQNLTIDIKMFNRKT